MSFEFTHGPALRRGRTRAKVSGKNLEGCMSKVTATVQLTPAMMAAAFWGMENSEQAKFFEELNALIQQDYATDPKSQAWSLGEMQWHYLGGSLAENKPARDMLMAMAAPLYLHTLRAAPWGSV